MTETKLKILFFTDHFPPEPSAPAAHIFDRARMWSRDGHQVTIVASHPNAPIGEIYPGYTNSWRRIESLEGVRVVRVKTLIAPNSARAAVRFADYLSYFFSATLQSLREERPDVVISSSPHIFVPLAGVWFSLLRRVPHVFEVRDLWPATIAAVTGLGTGWAYRLLERMELWMYARSRRVIVLTESFREDLLQRKVPQDKVDVVYNGADLTHFTPASEKDASLLDELRLDGKIVIGFLGTLGLAQDLVNALKAAQRVESKALHFLFVGAGAEQEKLVDYAVEHAIDNVTFVGRQEKKDMPAYLSLCDIALVHLKNDPLFRTVIPSKIFESMAVGLPILYVSPPDSEGGAIVARHEAGVLVDAGDPDALAREADRLAGDAALRERLARASRESAALYSREKQASNTLRVMQTATRA